MNFNEIINNSAFMGIIGVILGAVISGILGSINNKDNLNFQKRQEWVERTEKTTIGFLILIQKVYTLNLAAINTPNDKKLIQKMKTEILVLNEQVKAEAQLYYEKKIMSFFGDLLNAKFDFRSRNGSF